MPIFAKDASTRVAEGMDYILTRVPVEERPAIRRYMQAVVALQGEKTFSAGMSTKASPSAGDAATREMKRALVFMMQKMNAANPRNRTDKALMAMSDFETKLLFDELLPKFRVWATQEEGDWRLLRDRLHEFIAHPRAFLTANKMMVQSWKNRGTLDMVETYRFSYDYAWNRFVFLPGAYQSTFKGGIEVKVIAVPEVYWFDVPGRGSQAMAGGGFASITPTRLAGADIMVTSAFSGCSFLWKQEGAITYAAHINPSGVNTSAGPDIGGGEELAKQLCGQKQGIAGARFKWGPLDIGNINVFGKDHANVPAHPHGYQMDPQEYVLSKTSMLMFGLRQGAKWRFYSQENTARTQFVRELT